jgi:hypothetical protein
MSYTYLASPYTSADHTIMDERYAAACKTTAWLLNNKVWVYSPIVHCHELAKMFNLPRDLPFWWDYNRNMLIPAKRLLILVLPGWEDSAGVTQETQFAADMHKPVEFIHPDTHKIARIIP